jgi:hypothetical protein
MNVMELHIKGFSFLAEDFHPIFVTLGRKVRRTDLHTQPTCVSTGKDEPNSRRYIILKVTVDPLFLPMTALHALVDFITENVLLIVSGKQCFSPNGDNNEVTGQERELLFRKSRMKSARKEQ